MDSVFVNLPNRYDIFVKPESLPVGRPGIRGHVRNTEEFVAQHACPQQRWGMLMGCLLVSGTINKVFLGG